MCYRCVLKFKVVDGCFGDIYMLQVFIVFWFGILIFFYKVGVMGQVVLDGVFLVGVVVFEEGEYFFQFVDDFGECQVFFCG